MYDLNLFSVPLFLSKLGHVYELQKLEEQFLKTGDILETCIKLKMKDLFDLLSKQDSNSEIDDLIQESTTRTIAAII